MKELKLRKLGNFLKDLPKDTHNMDGLVWFKYDEGENILYAMV